MKPTCTTGIMKNRLSTDINYQGQLITPKCALECVKWIEKSNELKVYGTVKLQKVLWPSPFGLRSGRPVVRGSELPLQGP